MNRIECNMKIEAVIKITYAYIWNRFHGSINDYNSRPNYNGINLKPVRLSKDIFIKFHRF